MTYGKKPATLSNVYTFSDVVDKACEQLMDSQIKYSIRRIQVMDDRLAALEKELDDFLLQKNGKI
jgi:DNA-dependent RNA polymerase auxiliary subunit epsilon